MKKLLLSIAFLLSALGFSQTLTALDTSFGTAGISTITGTGVSPAGIKVLDDGKILILTRIDNIIKLIRLMPDGSVDNTYISQLVSIPDSSSIYPDSMIMQTDGKIVVEIGGVSNTLVRFNTDGTIDTSFGVNGYVANCFQTLRSYYSRLAYDPLTGNIYVAGNPYNSSSGTYYAIIECYTTAGILNTSFNSTGFKTWTSSYSLVIKGIAIDSLGKIDAVGSEGYQGQFGGTTESHIFRVNSDGSMDTTFSGDGLFVLRQGGWYNEYHDSSESVYFKDDGSIVIMGFIGWAGNYRYMMYELTNVGVLVSASMPTSFPAASGTWIDRGSEIVRDSNGKYLLGGSVYDSYVGSNFGIIRVNSNYTIDSAFGINGWITSYNQDFKYTLGRMAIQTDNKILVVGFSHTSPTRIIVARYLETTTLGSEGFEKNSPIIFPNPVNDVVNIAVDDISFLNTPFYIADVNGRIIDKGILTNPTSEINVGKLSKGIYFIKFENQNLVKKFIKQ